MGCSHGIMVLEEMMSEAHVDLYRNRVKEIENMEVSVSNGKSTFIIVRPESEDYSSLFKLSEETARVVNGTPIIDLHLTVQAIRNVEDFEALRKASGGILPRNYVPLKSTSEILPE